MLNDRLDILHKVAAGTITPADADKELFVLYSIMRSREPKGIVNHINGVLRSIISRNKEDINFWQERNISMLKHCISQLEKITKNKNHVSNYKI